MAGRPPLPAKVKRARGNAGKREIKPNIEPAPAGPRPPAWVADDPRSLAQWQGLAPEMIKHGTLTVFDVNRFGIYCVLMGEFVRGIPDFRKLGLVVQVKNGLAKSPAATILLDLASEIRGLGDPMGFNPTARAKLFAPESGEDAAKHAARAEFFGGKD